MGRSRKKKKRKEKACGSKFGHKTIDGAYAEMRSINKRNFIFHQLQPYKCKYCGLWHIGKTKKIYYDKFDQLLN